MENNLQRQSASSSETGLAITGNYRSGSGFNHILGTRDFGNLKIIEGISVATSMVLLGSVRVYDERGTLLLDLEVKGMTFYSRELVRTMVRDGLLKMLRQAAAAQGRTFDPVQAFRKTDEMLNDAYYTESRKAVIEWAETTGII